MTGQFVHPQAVPPASVHGPGGPSPVDVRRDDREGGYFQQPPGGQFLHSSAAEPELARGTDLGGDRYPHDGAGDGWSVAPAVIGGAESLPSPIPRPPAPKPQAKPEPEPEPRKRSLWGKITGRDPGQR